MIATESYILQLDEYSDYAKKDQVLFLRQEKPAHIEWNRVHNSNEEAN